MAEEKQLELEPSLDEDIAAAIDKVAGKDYDPIEDDEAEIDVKADSDTETVEEPEEKPKKQEDESDQDDDNDEEDEADESEADDESDEDDDKEDKADVSAPEHWPQDDRDAFTKLDAGAQTLVLEQNKRFEQRHQVHADKVRESDALRKAFAPYERDMQLASISPTELVNRMAGLHGLLTQEPVEGLRWVAKNYGGAIRDKAGFLKSLATEMGVELTAGQETEPQYIDQKAGAEIDGLKAQIARFEQTQTASQTAAVEGQVQQAQAELNQFAAAKDDAGNPKHPHFEQVRLKMADLYKVDPTKSMEDIYGDAVMLTPALRQQIIDIEAKEKAKVNGKAERLKKAKKAGRNVRGDVKVGAVDHDNMSVGDTVRAAVEQSM